MEDRTELIEYRVRPDVRYHITRFERREDGACHVGGALCGVWFDNAQTAYDVAYALARADHEKKGWPLGDERIQYPRHPAEGNEETPPVPEGNAP